MIFSQANSVTMRFWKVPKRRSIFPLACGLGATRGETPRAVRARWNSERGSRSSACGRMAEQGQAIGVEGHGQALEGKSAAEVLEVVPGGVGGNEDGGQEFAGMVVHREQEGLIILGGPSRVDGGESCCHSSPGRARSQRRRGLAMGAGAL